MNEPDLRFFHGHFCPVISQAVRKPCPRGGVPVSPFPRKMIGIWISRFTMGPWIHDRFLDSRWVLHPQEGGRLDAKRHYVILAKALDGIWPVGHACAVLC